MTLSVDRLVKNNTDHIDIATSVIQFIPRKAPNCSWLEAAFRSEFQSRAKTMPRNGHTLPHWYSLWDQNCGWIMFRVDQYDCYLPFPKKTQVPWDLFWYDPPVYWFSRRLHPTARFLLPLNMAMNWSVNPSSLKTLPRYQIKLVI